VKEALSQFAPPPSVSVDRAVYFLILDRVEGHNTVDRIPLKEGVRVLDAIRAHPVASKLRSKLVYIYRYSPEPFLPQILPVDWKELEKDRYSSTNYELFPNDDVFLVHEGRATLSDYADWLRGKIWRLGGIPACDKLTAP